jgi:hypothetical protein
VAGRLGRQGGRSQGEVSALLHPHRTPSLWLAARSRLKSNTAPARRATLVDVIQLTSADWQLEAKCAELPIAKSDAMFFPERGGSSKAAREMCARCSVRDQCLELVQALQRAGFLKDDNDPDPESFCKLKSLRGSAPDPKRLFVIERVLRCEIHRCPASPIPRTRSPRHGLSRLREHAAGDASTSLFTLLRARRSRRRSQGSQSKSK